MKKFKHLKKFNESTENRDSYAFFLKEEEAFLQKAIKMLEDTDKIESGEYYFSSEKNSEYLHIRGKDFLIKLTTDDLKFYYDTDNLMMTINLTKSKYSEIKEKFEKAKAKAKQDIKSDSDPFAIVKSHDSNLDTAKELIKAAEKEKEEKRNKFLNL